MHKERTSEKGSRNPTVTSRQILTQRNIVKEDVMRGHMNASKTSLSTVREKTILGSKKEFIEHPLDSGLTYTKPRTQIKMNIDIPAWNPNWAVMKREKYARKDIKHDRIGMNDVEYV